MKARVCLTLAGVLVVGACGGSDPQSGDGADSPSSAEATPTTSANDLTATTAAPTTAAPTTTGDTSTTADDADPAGVWGTPEVTADAHACSTTEGGADVERAPTLMVVDRTTGALVWQMCQDGLAMGQAAVEAEGVVVYAGAVARDGGEGDEEATAGLIGFDSSTGEQLWALETDGTRIVGASDEVVYARGTTPEGASSDPATVLDPLIAIDARTGREMWRADQFSVALFPDGYGDAFVVAQGAEDLALHAFEAATGDERWQAEALAPFAVRDRGVVVIRGESLAAASTAVLDPESGSDVWSASGRPMWASDEVVYVAVEPPAPKGGPLRIEARAIVDGTVTAAFELPGSPDPSGYDSALQGTPGDVLFVVDGPGLVAVHGADGSTLWTPPFPFLAGLDGETVIDAAGAVGVVTIVDARTGDPSVQVEVPCLAGGGACEVGYVAAVALAGDHLILTVTNDTGD